MMSNAPSNYVYILHSIDHDSAKERPPVPVFSDHYSVADRLTQKQRTYYKPIEVIEILQNFVTMQKKRPHKMEAVDIF